MINKAKLIKGLVKQNVAPKSTFGTDPRDPWSAKANISEDALLDKFLNSRGINPKFVSKDTKDSHSKTGEFQKWKQDHLGIKIESMTTSQTPTELRKKALEKSEKVHKQVHSNGDLIKSEDVIKNVKRWVLSKDASSRAGIEIGKMMKAQQGGDKATANKHFNRYKKLNKFTTEAVDKMDTITLDIPLMIRVLEYAREDAKDDMALHKVVEKLIGIRDRGILTMDDYDYIVKIKEDVDLGFEYDLIECNDKPEDMKKLVARLKYAKDSETLRKKQLAIGEDVYQDPNAATQTVFDGANNTNDTSVSIVRRQLSKSARMIKALYKNKGMKEDLNDWEKEDKSVASPGKKPKLQTMDKKLGLGEKPKAAAIMTGGKTLTGTPRDDIEIDPVMKQRPGANPDKMNQQNQQKV